MKNNAAKGVTANAEGGRPCPHCGYCPHCGRAAAAPYPTWIPVYPASPWLWYSQPSTYTGSVTNSPPANTGTITVTAGNFGTAYAWSSLTNGAQPAIGGAVVSS